MAQMNQWSNELGRKISLSQLCATPSIDPHFSSFRSKPESCGSIVLLSSVAIVLVESTAKTELHQNCFC